MTLYRVRLSQITRFESRPSGRVLAKYTPGMEIELTDAEAHDYHMIVEKITPAPAPVPAVPKLTEPMPGATLSGVDFAAQPSPLREIAHRRRPRFTPDVED